MVKFIKYNFLENRLFADEEVLNSSFLKWLDRTGNAKVHGTTKKIPAKVFEDEREHLRPLLDIRLNGDVTICRNVRKDNTIVYDSNRYSLPLGTYNNQKEVSIEAKNEKLTIMTVFGEFICEHPISTGRGQLIKSTSHSRDITDSMDKAQTTVDELLLFKATGFLQTIRTEKARYARDQFRLLQTLCDNYGIDDVLNAIRYCEVSKLFGITYVKDFLEHSAKPKQVIVLNAIPVSNNKYHVTTEKRSLDVYAKVGSSH
ncbi:hypothetical protein [Desulfosporosinus sp. FKB]|uniref:Mu transposase domain-containing protein n=1 Tax=Desulfosporosinus sp. FKB TaxID=1969835 RepID=UPI001FA8C324|nr:hypothetical protein [Desulfosporosinus sp. FKB]